MSDRYYPPVSDEMLKYMGRIVKLYENDKNFFDYPECPYPQEFKDIFKGTAMYHDYDSHKLDEVPTADNLLVSINTLQKQLKEYGAEIKGNSESSASDQNTYFRLSVTLLDKLVTLRESVSKVSEFDKFVDEMISVMDKVLTVDQRSVVLAKLNEIAGRAYVAD